MHHLHRQRHKTACSMKVVHDSAQLQLELKRQSPSALICSAQACMLIVLISDAFEDPKKTAFAYLRAELSNKHYIPDI